MSDADQLVKMANDIGHFFGADPSREDAVTGMAQHIKSYWTKRMRDKLTARLARGEAALDELPRAALLRLSEPQAVPGPPPGGDAG
jgi:formate dehydrogenase subunit delta